MASETFIAGLFPGVIDEDPAHHSRGNSEKLRAVLPLNFFQVHKLAISLVDQGRCLKRVARPFSLHTSCSETPQFIVNKRDELFERLLVSIAPCQKELCN